uniref:Uncharacterized protein n=1 Tax=Oryza meridionalis TaxID=40149 RepID=A0A0E0FA75_9ORYZ
MEAPRGRLSRRASHGNGRDGERKTTTTTSSGTVAVVRLQFLIMAVAEKQVVVGQCESNLAS